MRKGTIKDALNPDDAANKEASTTRQVSLVHIGSMNMVKAANTIAKTSNRAGVIL